MTNIKRERNKFVKLKITTFVTYKKKKKKKKKERKEKEKKSRTCVDNIWKISFQRNSAAMIV
jgi:hypothetical protein